MSVPDDSRDGGVQLGRPLITVFWVSVSIFIFLIGFIFLQNFISGSSGMFRYTFFLGVVALIILGISLIILARRAAIKRSLKIAFILTGVSIVGMPACTILHNVVYGVLIAIFGEGVWGAGGGDEAFFFIMALIVFPLVLIISAVTAVVIMARDKRQLSA